MLVVVAVGTVLRATVNVDTSSTTCSSMTVANAVVTASAPTNKTSLSVEYFVLVISMISGIETILVTSGGYNQCKSICIESGYR